MGRSSKNSEHTERLSMDELRTLGGGVLHTSNDHVRDMIETYHDFGTNGWALNQHQYFEAYKEVSSLKTPDSNVFKYLPEYSDYSQILELITSEYAKYRLVKSPAKRRDYKDCGLAGLVLFCHGPNLSFDDFLWASMDDSTEEVVYKRGER